jgi:ATP-dependent DNA helicase DinG
MGQVIPIKDATRVAAGDTVLTFIDECYARMCAVPGFSMRPGQKDLSYEVCKSLVAGIPLAAEAPTGTGKTLAYLIGAIAASETLRTLKDIPVVVATATVGLQSQILTGDLPKLFQAGIVNPSEALLAKGRSRYFCVQSAERLTQDDDGSAQVDFFDESANVENQSLSEISEMLEEWNRHTWTGDFDSYTGMPSLSWSRVAASSDTCVGHKCEHYATCPFFNARRALSSARIIIANHNMVLSDLTMAKEGIDPLFPGGKYLVVFDEAHHLPDKALDAGSAKLEFSSVLSELPKLLGYSKAWQRQPELMKILSKQKLVPEDFDPAALINALEAARFETSGIEVDPENFQLRFEQGVLPENVREALTAAQASTLNLAQSMRDATQGLKQSNLADKSAAMGALQLELLYQAAGISGALSGLQKALALLLAPTRAVRWMFRKELSVSLHVAPLEGADVLRDLLWGSERVSSVMVSATLQDFDGFARFRSRCGAPDSMRTFVLPHIFPYETNKLYLVDMVNSPKQDERAAFQKELLEILPSFIDANEGTLILFPSRFLMRQALPELKKHFGTQVLGQDDMGIKGLIAKHRQRIDSGKGSVLCGLATLAEGLDLPGSYCTHVIICTIPFTVPTSPVERELQEVLGKDYFYKRALPDALIKLTQMVGRLMRRETDRGRITIFDKRLKYSKWGQKMLAAVPQFTQKEIGPRDALDGLSSEYRTHHPGSPEEANAA